MVKRALTLQEIKMREKMEKIEERKQLNLNGSLSIPSITNGYSIGVGYLKDWFFDKIQDSTFHFKYFSIDEANYNSAFDRSEMYKNIKIQKPSLMILPKIDYQWNREGIDHTLYGSHRFLQYNGYDRAFFKDPIHNIFLGMETEILRIGFSLRSRLESRPQQIDLMKKINLNCRMGSTETNYIDMDFHIPYDIICQVAKDVGFKVIEYKDEEKYEAPKIEDIQGLVAYLNTHSQYPILYKYRRLTGKFEFFMRMNNMYVHLDCRDELDLDDGEQVEQTKTNYIIEQRVGLDIVVPKFYAYYSRNKHEIKQSTSFKYTSHVANIQLPDIPDVNDKGWNKYYEVDIEEDDLKKPLHLEFEGLFNDDSEEIELIKKIIDHNNECLISPSIFIELKLFNDGQEINYTIDWKNFTLESENILNSCFTHLLMYIDRKYLNEYKINMDNLSDDRFRQAENQK